MSDLIDSGRPVSRTESDVKVPDYFIEVEHRVRRVLRVPAGTRQEALRQIETYGLANAFAEYQGTNGISNFRIISATLGA